MFLITAIQDFVYNLHNEKWFMHVSHVRLLQEYSVNVFNAYLVLWLDIQSVLSLTYYHDITKMRYVNIKGLSVGLVLSIFNISK